MRFDYKTNHLDHLNYDLENIFEVRPRHNVLSHFLVHALERRNRLVVHALNEWPHFFEHFKCMHC